jgi:CheY-like chemotaxis protein
MCEGQFGKPVEILLVEDNPGDARLLREMLADAGADSYELTHFTRLSGALEAVGSPIIPVKSPMMTTAM